MKIDVWYGKEQRFGYAGLPQRWVNILGRVKGVHAGVRLKYQLNGGQSINATLGPDHRRLSAVGDFNVDIDYRKLNPGLNRLLLTASDDKGHVVEEEVQIDFDFPKDRPFLPHKIEWRHVPCVQDAVQIVDGLWSLDGGVLSPIETGYDRLVGIGDMHWRDYEVVVPITVHGIDSACYLQPSIHAGVGVVLRWRGHTNWNTDSWTSGQPYCGPSTYGAIGWYCVFHETGSEINFFDTEFGRPVRFPISLAVHQPYWFKLRAQTVGEQSTFSMKVWAVGDTEPDNWMLHTEGTPFSLLAGGLLLAAHHVAAAFGDIEVTPL